MGKRSFALGVLTALATAAAVEDSHTHTYTTPVTTTHTYVQGGTPVRTVYTSAPTLTEQARVPFEKMMKVNKAFTISGSDCLYETGKEIRRIYLEDETTRTSLTFNERKVVRKLVDAYDLPIGDAKMLAFRFGRLVKSTMV